MAAHLTRSSVSTPRSTPSSRCCPNGPWQGAAAADEALARGESVGPLHGLPIAHKDLIDTAGIRTTYGSPIYRDHVPKQDALIVERLRSAGAITIGKTNTPEFGAGSQTYNEVFGETLNPYDLTKTCGGSSGGAAVALACGMIPIADGSDTGGSLRNPASFNNVVGFRVSPGRVPAWPSPVGWFPISTPGPMARTVQDVALLLSAMAGPDDRSPISIVEPGTRFREPLERDFSGIKIAWSRDLASFPVDPRVTAVIDGQRSVFEDLGCVVDDGEPDFRDADEVFKVWRAWRFELGFGPLLEKHRDQIKETIIWNAEAGAKLTGPEIGRAEMKRTALYHRVREFMEDADGDLHRPGWNLLHADVGPCENPTKKRRGVRRENLRRLFVLLLGRDRLLHVQSSRRWLAVRPWPVVWDRRRGWDRRCPPDRSRHGSCRAIWPVARWR